MYRFLHVHVACCSRKIRIHCPCKPRELRTEEPALSVVTLALCLPWASQSPLSKASKGFLSLMLHLFICWSRQRSGKCYKGAEIVSWQVTLRAHFCLHYQSNLCCLKKSFFLWVLVCSFSHTLRVSLISHWLISSLAIMNPKHSCVLLWV